MLRSMVNLSLQPMLKFIRFIFTKTFWVNIGVYLVLLVIGIWAYFLYLGTKTNHGEQIHVPLLIGYHITEAQNILTQENLRDTVIDSIYVEDTPGGMVVEQNPDSGFAVKSGRKIYLTLSSYQAPKIPVPNLKSDSKRNAISQLTSMGFKIGELRYIPSICEDCVMSIEIDSNEIEPGTRLDIGTKLDLVLGGGASDQFVPVPYLIGTPLKQLENTVLNTGLILGSVVPDEEIEDSSKALVYKQMPEPGSGEVRIGTPINLFLTTDRNKLPENALDSLRTDSLYENQ
jgi:beta-lactam-binding protein with PASTA domain